MNKLLKTLTYLKEELKDIPATGKNIHFTNMHNLYQMMREGYIEGNTYPVSSDKFRVGKRDNDDHAEICTTRPSSTKQKENTNALSGNIDGVKITLFTDRILASLPTMRKAKIAEFAKPYAEESTRIRALIKKEFGIVLPQSIDKKHIYAFKNPGDNDVNNYEILYRAKDFIKDGSITNYPRFEFLFDDWKDNKEAELNNLEAGSHREAEERFVYNKDKITGIPVDPKYMKIEFVKVPRLTYFNPEYSNQAEESCLRRCEYMINALKTNEMFVKNTYLNDTVKKLEEYRDKAKQILFDKNPKNE